MSPTIEARPTIYNGIQMRSRLEADYAAHLDREGRQWEYEPECFASADGQWLPDFRVTHSSGNQSLIELKPAGRLDEDFMSGQIDKHLTRMMIAWTSKPDTELALVYWEYGGKVAALIESMGRGSPWLAHWNLKMPLLWTGMGQYDRCADTP